MTEPDLPPGQPTHRARHTCWRGLLGAAALGLAATTANAAELTLTISGLASADGALGCALFAEAAFSLAADERRSLTLQRDR